VEEHPCWNLPLRGAARDFSSRTLTKRWRKAFRLFVWTRMRPRSKRVLYIGTDNFKAGRESLKRMAALVPRGSIAVVTIFGAA